MSELLLASRHQTQESLEGLTECAGPLHSRSCDILGTIGHEWAAPSLAPSKLNECVEHVSLQRVHATTLAGMRHPRQHTV